MTFKEKVYKVVKEIPKGSVLTYAEVARRINHPKAARAVGNILSENYDINIPCHRVIRSDGRLGSYNRGGESVKRSILRQEGVQV